jgi:hypothetical protein
MDNNTTLEWFKVLSELLGKIAYPLLVLILFVYIFNSSFAEKILFSINKATIGEIKIEFNDALKDSATDTAKLNSSITKFQSEIKSLKLDLDKLKENDTSNNSDYAAEKEKIENKIKTLSENSKYTVLVFNRPAHIDIATKFTANLVELGFSASRITSDLKEIANPLVTGEIFIARNQRGDVALNLVKEVLGKQYSQIPITIQTSYQPLKRGDIQISFF